MKINNTIISKEVCTVVLDEEEIYRILTEHLILHLLEDLHKKDSVKSNVFIEKVDSSTGFRLKANIELTVNHPDPTNDIPAFRTHTPS